MLVRANMASYISNQFLYILLKFRQLRNKGRWLMLDVRCLPD